MMAKTKSFHPPDKWRTLYSKLRNYRKCLTAPVDTVGCDCLADVDIPEETKRFQTLIALMLSSQTKDHVTAEAMEKLKCKVLTPQSVNTMADTEVDSCIRKVSFHNVKTKHIKQVADILLKEFDGHVPRTYEQVISLPGVGPKMAHLFFQAADNKVLGIGVDTHVHRLSQRFGWVPPTVRSPEQTRKVLESWLPKRYWSEVNHLMVGLGQTVCTPLSPHCEECVLKSHCPNAFNEKKRRAAQTAKGKAIVDVEDLIQNSANHKIKQKAKKQIKKIKKKELTTEEEREKVTVNKLQEVLH